MTTIQTTGFRQDNLGAYITKDPTAQLIYTLDWSQWLTANDTVQSVTYTLQVRANDPTPLVLVAHGLAQNNTETYCEISGGGASKVYQVTATITTQNNLIDSRSFRIKVENRSA